MAENKKKDSMSEGIKAEINKQRKEQGQKGFGEYDEAPGGGTPGEKGGRGSMGGNFEVVNSKEEAEQIKKEDPNAVIRYNQPRDENGQFTYNSANGKGISTEKSRGTTKPPFLNGVDLTFIKKGSTFQYQQDEKMKRIISSIDVSAEELVNACKVYFETEGGFLGVIGTAITKKGSPSKIEKTGVTGKTGEIDLSTKSEETQKASEEAAKNKNEKVLKEQANISPKTQMASVGTKNINVQKPVQPKPTIPSTNNTPQPKTTNVDTSKIFVKKNENISNNQNVFGDNVKQEIKANPKEWAQKNKEKIKQVLQKHPGTTPNAVLNAIYSGKVKSWEQLLK